MTFLRMAVFIGLLFALTPARAQTPPVQTPPAESGGASAVGDPGELGATAAIQTRDVAYWRSRIDAADRQIIKLLNERAGYVSQLIPLKTQANSAVRDAAREREVLAKLTSRNQGPLPHESVVRIYEAIMAEMRLLQEQAR